MKVNSPDSRVSGFLLVDKPLGVTSFDVVAMCRRVFGTKKVGHSGTLDPFASGLLIIAFGEALKLLEYLPAEPKVYTGGGVFGVTSDTLDREGKLSVRCDESVVKGRVSRDGIEGAICENLLGVISQTPPKYSALKIDGVSAHYRVRRGEEVTMKPRRAEVFAFDIPTLDLPGFTFRCSVGSGTYVRSLIDTLGSLLDVGAYVTDLRRESIGHFFVTDAHTVDKLSRSDIDVSGLLLPIEAGVSQLPRVDISSSEYARLEHGLTIDFPFKIDASLDDNFPTRIYSAFLDSRCVGVLEVTEDNRLKFRKLIHRI